ncbi:hypothetical protein [Nitrosospira sp. Is2]|uniref:hypothetical protein n=1 Tax=Nitrosospira sp. Is2 TaxID=3080532 RepID=UPI002955B953|nr:hypothetical protein [Nitrosospira sp. Is2]WON73532.1 hypothetical protein R5L00_13780 [Nitrosospira sp. Is2]
MEGVLHAIDLLKDWMNYLLTMQSAGIALVGKQLSDRLDPRSKRFAGTSIGFFLVSIIAGANLMGSLPYLAQDAAQIKDIYMERGNLNIPIDLNATIVAVCFILGLIFFALLAWSLGESPSNVDDPDH